MLISVRLRNESPQQFELESPEQLDVLLRKLDKKSLVSWPGNAKGKTVSEIRAAREQGIDLAGVRWPAQPQELPRGQDVGPRGDSLPMAEQVEPMPVEIPSSARPRSEAVPSVPLANPSGSQALDTLSMQVKQLQTWAAQQEQRGNQSSQNLDNLRAWVGERVEQVVVKATETLRAVETELRTDLRLEREELELLGQERSDLIRRYKPGQIEELRQQIQALRELETQRRAELAAEQAKVDQLERQYRATGGVDPAELERLRGLARESGRRETQLRELQIDKDKLTERLRSHEEHYDRYQEVIAAQAQDESVEKENTRLNTQLAEADRQRQAAVHDREAAVQDLRHWRERHDAMSSQARNSAENLRTATLELAQVRVDFSRSEAALAVLQEKAAEVAQRDAELNDWWKSRSSALDDRQRQLESVVRERLEGAERDHVQRTRNLHQAYEAKRNALRMELETAADANVAESVEALRTDVVRAKAENERLHYEKQTLADELEAAQTALLQQVLNRDELERACAAAEHRRDEAADAADDLAEKAESLRQDLDGLRAQAAVLNTELREGRLHHEKRLADLRSQYDRELELLHSLHAERRKLSELISRESRLASIHGADPAFAADHPALVPRSEALWLDDVHGRMQEAGFEFPPRLLAAFHTSLKVATWAPLTVLAGVSGTGKSELPRLYSAFGGLRFLPVPVQPQWDGPSDLLGFFNYVEGRYKATPFIRALTQSQRRRDQGGFADGVLLVLLDEMNLAKVELYFSEFLSRLELRRGLKTMTVDLDVGAGEKVEQIVLGSNVLFAGTMNEDESTHTLSDKVLDRGNVVAFPRPRHLRSRSLREIKPVEQWLSMETWQGWQVDVNPEAPEQVLIRESLDEINEALGCDQRAVGHRVLQAISYYVANHPLSRAVPGSDQGWRTAFADQLVQKIMPKLRGLDPGSDSGKRCLDGVRDVLNKQADELCPDFDQACEKPTFLWSGTHYLNQQVRGW